MRRIANRKWLHMNNQNPGANNGAATGVTTRLKVKSGETNSAIPLLTTLVTASTKFKGQLNAEITPPTSLHDEWIIVQRFSTEAEAIAWRDSDTRKAILGKLAPYLMERGMADDTSQNECDGSVAAVISSMVKPGLEEGYFAWLNVIQTEQALSPGYQGTFLQMQKTGESSLWTTMLRFSTQEGLEEWMVSKRRLELVEQSKKFISSESIKRMTSSFPGWLPVDESGESPANWKAAALVLLGLYPIVCLQIRFLSPALANVNGALGNFIGNTMSVALVTWMTMPFLTNVFGKWLLPPKGSKRSTIELIGLTTIIALFVGEVLVFWNFL
jgi:antibiotic biosynthesis monooxygenase (ABM) superfamily enzyme